MAHSRLLTVVTVLLMVGGAVGAQDEPGLDDLLTIEKLIDAREWQALYYFIVANPQLTEGQSPLAAELRSYVEDAKRGRLVGFDAPAEQRQPVATQSASSASASLSPDVSIY